MSEDSRTRTENYGMILPQYNETVDIEDINYNTELIDTEMAGMKPKQTAVPSPSSVGNSKAFITTISQNENGVITAEKSDIPTMTRGTGGSGLCPAAPTGSGTTKYLREDGNWEVPPDTTYNNATTSAAGLMSSADKTKLNGIANNATANVGTITGITMNGSSKGTSGVVNLGTVKTAWRGYTIKHYSGPNVGVLPNTSVSWKANQFKDSSGNSVSTPSGYTPVAIVFFSSGNRYIHVSYVNAQATGETNMMEVRNVDSSGRDCTAKVSVLYLQTGT